MKTLLKILKRAALVAGGLVALYALFLLTVAIMPGMEVMEQGIERRNPPPSSAIAAPKEDVAIDAGGVTMRGWLFLPVAGGRAAPCVVMGHGLGGVLGMGLDRYAARFRDAGFAVLAFDYRHFGLSDGEPRHLIWIPSQLEDYRAAVAYARRRPEIDPDRIALWGTSFSGGHVIVIAAEDPRIACVSAQCPSFDGRAAMEQMAEAMPLSRGLKMLVHGLRDLVRSWMGLPAHTIPMLGRPGTVAIYTNPDEYEFFARVAPAGYPNVACARIIVRGDKYRPLEYASRVACPVLIQVGDRDELLPAAPVEETAEILGSRAEVRHYPFGHFDFYRGTHFEEAVRDQVAFFSAHLHVRR